VNAFLAFDGKHSSNIDLMNYISFWFKMSFENTSWRAPFGNSIHAKLQEVKQMQVECNVEIPFSNFLEKWKRKGDYVTMKS
jgi:hypothetical protein